MDSYNNHFAAPYLGGGGGDRAAPNFGVGGRKFEWSFGTPIARFFEREGGGRMKIRWKGSN